MLWEKMFSPNKSQKQTSIIVLNRPAADAAAPVEVDKDDEEAVEVEENDYEDDGGRGR